MTKPTKNRPRLRFPEFHGNWEAKRLSEVCDFEQGLQVDLSLQSKVIKPGYINFVRIENVTQSSADYRFISTELSRNKILKKTDIIVVRYGASAGFIGRGFSGVLANNLFTVKPKRDGIQLDYLYIYLRSEKTYSFFQSEMAGGAMPALSFGIAGSLWLPIPSLPEQQKIADFLSAVDRKIEQLARRKALLEEYKKGVMQKIFSQKLRFKDENGKSYPKWEEQRLGEVLRFLPTNSLSRDSLTYEIDEAEYYNIHYGDIHTRYKANFYGQNEKIPAIRKGVDTSRITSDQYCQVGDVVIADASEDYNDIGKVVEIRSLPQKPLLAGLHTFLARETVKTAPGFKSYLLRSDKVRRQIMYKAQGISVLGISKRNLETIKISLPSLPEQQKIAGFLSALDVKIEKFAAQIEKSQEFKKGLLQQMFV